APRCQTATRSRPPNARSTNGSTVTRTSEQLRSRSASTPRISPAYRASGWPDGRARIQASATAPAAATRVAWPVPATGRRRRPASLSSACTLTSVLRLRLGLGLLLALLHRVVCLECVLELRLDEALASDCEDDLAHAHDQRERRDHSEDDESAVVRI